jgi:hypothetical protein
MSHDVFAGRTESPFSACAKDPFGHTLPVPPGTGEKNGSAFILFRRAYDLAGDMQNWTLKQEWRLSLGRKKIQSAYLFHNGKYVLPQNR